MRQADPRLLRHPLLAEAIPHVGHFVTRNRGTVCGSVAHADPAGELPLCLTLLGGSVRAASIRGERVIAASDFFVGNFTTALEPDELVVETSWPTPTDGSGYGFFEFAQRRGDYGLCMAAAAVGDGQLRVALGSVLDRPTLVDVDPERPGESAAAQVEPWGNLHASPAYLKQLVQCARRSCGRHGQRAGGMIPLSVTVNGRVLPRGRAGPPAAVRLPAPHARAHGDACRLRARSLRGVHRLAGRGRRPLVHHARGAGGRTRASHGGRARRRRRAQSAPAVVPGLPCPPVRLLHARDPHGGDRPALTRRQTGPRRDRRPALRAPLPVHGLHADRRRDREGVPAREPRPEPPRRVGTTP